MHREKQDSDHPPKTRKRIYMNNLAVSIIVLLIICFTACNKKEDHISISTYKEIGVIKNLKGYIKDGSLYLLWGIPKDEYFNEEEIKGFFIFISKVPDGVGIENSECQDRAFDFILASKKSKQVRDSNLVDNNLKSKYEYIVKNVKYNQTYLCKVAVMDNNNRIGKDSNAILLKMKSIR